MFIEQKLRELMPFRDPRFDRCFCENCYGGDDEIAPEGGEGGKRYLVPRGWVGIGIAFPDRSIDWSWDTVYHGTMGQRVGDILAHRHVGMPGDKLADGLLLRAANSADRDDLQFYTSKTINYAGLQLYAPPTVWHTDDPREEFGARATQLVLQCKQNLQRARERGHASLPLEKLPQTGGVFTQCQTMGFEKPHYAGDFVCKHTDLHSWSSGIEILSNIPKECVPYRLLLRTFPGNPAQPPTKGSLAADNRPRQYETFRSPRDKPLRDHPPEDRLRGTFRGPQGYGIRWF